MMMALSGSTMDRNTTVRSTNDSPSTNTSTIHWYRPTVSRKSVKKAGFPPTNSWTPLTPWNAEGTIWVRRSRIAPKAASLEGSPRK